MKAKHRFFEPIPKPDERGERVSLRSIGGKPVGLIAAPHYQHKAYRMNGKVYVRVRNKRKKVPRPTSAIGASARLCEEDRPGIPPQGIQWYRMRYV